MLPETPSRKITRHIHEAAREVARAIAKTPAYDQTRRDRKKIEMLFAHLKRILRIERLRLRGPAGAQFKAPQGAGRTAIVAALQAWLREQRARLLNSPAVARPIDYLLRRWDRFARFIDDGRICLTNNAAAERALRGFALGRKSWLFAGSERGADRVAVMATLIMTAKLNDIDPQAWLAHVLATSTITLSTGWRICCRGTGPPRWSVVNWWHDHWYRLASRSPSMTSSRSFCAASRCRSTSSSTVCT